MLSVDGVQMCGLFMCLQFLIDANFLELVFFVMQQADSQIVVVQHSFRLSIFSFWGAWGLLMHEDESCARKHSTRKLGVCKGVWHSKFPSLAAMLHDVRSLTEVQESGP